MKRSTSSVDVSVDQASLREASDDLLRVARDLPLNATETRASETAMGSSEATAALARAAEQQAMRGELAQRAVTEAGAQAAAARAQFAELDKRMEAS